MIEAVDNQTTDELVLFSLDVNAADPDLPASGLVFSLDEAPEGAVIDALSGVISWTPTEAQGPGSYAFVVRVTDDGTPSLFDLEDFSVTVNEVNGAFLSNVHYNASTDTLTFVSEGGAENNVTITSPAADRLRIVVGAGEAIVLSGDTSLGFLLSADGTQLEIDTDLAAISLFGIDLAGGNDTLSLTNDADNELGSLTANGSEGSDSVTLNATSLDGSLSVTAESIVVDGTLSAAAGVALTGTGNTTILNDDIVTAGGAITINDSVILGDEAVVTLDTTNGGTVAAGGSITLAGTVDDDALASGLEFLGGTGGVVTLSGTIGGTLAPQFLTINAGDVAVQALVTTGTQSIAAEGDVTVAAGSGSASLNAIGSQTIRVGDTLTVQGGAGSGLSARIVSSAGQTIDANSILVSGGSVGNSSFADIRQTGIGAGQDIEASSITINGGTSGSDNFARIRNDGTGVTGAQTIHVNGPLNLIGGTGGAPDLGNFAQIRAAGTQIVDAGDTALFAGGAGFSNFAGIHSPDQDITIHGTLTLTGGSSVAGPTSAGGARIGGIGGVTTSPTNLDLTVEDSVTMFGGTEQFAGAVIGAAFQGGQTTDITMLVGGSLVMNAGAVPNSGARIGSPSENPMGGDISITVGGNITMAGSTTVGALGTVIRTTGGEVTLDAGGAITVAGSVLSGAQTVSAGGNITVTATGVTGAVLNATGPQSIVAGGTLSLRGGSAGTDRFALIFGTGQQIIDAGQITLQGGSGGTNNFAIITGSTQAISSVGDVELRGGQGINNNARIGGLGGGGAPDQPTNLTLGAGGDVLLQGGNVTGAGAQIGPSGTGAPAITNIAITAMGDVVLNAGTAAAARIGNGTNGAAVGSIISITAGESIQLNGTAQSAVIRTGGNVELHAGSTISEIANGFVVANQLLTTSTAGTTLIGPNQVSVFNGSSVSGDITLNNTSPLLTVTGISQASSAALVLSQVGNVAFTGNAVSGSQTISATGDITISPFGGPGAIVSAAGAQTVNAGGGLIVQSSPVGIGQLQAGGGQEIHARYVEVTAGAQIIGGEQLIETSGKNAAGEGLALREGAIWQQVAGGTQTIIVTNADRVILDSPGGGIASILSNNGTQTLTITGAGSNALVLGNPSSLGISQIAGARVQEVIAGAPGQAGSITITGRVADGLGTSIIVTAPVAGGSQVVSTSGTLSVFGGSVSTGDRAGVFANGFAADTDGDGDVEGGLQTISARSILLQGGASGTNNRAEVAANRGSQLVTVGDGGISLTGGTGGTNNQAAIRQGVSPGTLPEDSQPVSQTVTVTGGGISLQGGSGAGGNNGVFIAGADQDISATGSVTLSSGSAGNSAANIGSVSGRPTNLTLDVGGDIVLTGGGVGSAAFIGSAGTVPGQPNNLDIDAGGNVILNVGAGSGARIGSSTAAAAAAGNISISAGGDIQLNGTATQVARIRTLDNVTLDAGGSISETLNGVIEANTLTTISGGGTSLIGPNQVAVFDATNTTSGNVTLVDAGGLTVTGISNPLGDISVSTTGQMTVTGSLYSGTHDMSLTAPGGVFFTGDAVLNIDLGGVATDQFTTVTISGNVTLGGTLDVEEVNGFAPTSGNRFQFMTFASRAGFFEAINLPTQFYYVDESDATDLELVFDDASPTVTIDQAASQPDPTNTSPISFTVLFSEAVFGFDAGDISFAGSTLSNLAANVTGSGANYTVTVTGMNGVGTVVASVVDDAAFDFVGNLSDASTSTDNMVTFDNVAPTVTINQAAGQPDPTNASPISFTVLFSEAVLGFDGSDISFAGSTLSNLTASVTGSGGSYTVLVTGMNGIGTVVASVVDDAVTDLAGNLSSPSTSTDNMVTFDNVAPTVTIDQAVFQADPTNASPISFTVFFSEAVLGFDAGDISFAGSTLSNLVANVTGSGANYTVTVTGMNGVGTVVTSVGANAATDAAGNFSTASTSMDNMVTFDNVAPTVTIDQAAGQPDPTNASPISFTVLFSEAVLGFDGSDISFAGSTLSNLTASVTGSGASYTVLVTGMNGVGTVVASVVDDAVMDLAGNLSSPSTSTDNMVTFDNVAPTVTINQAAGQPDPTNASPISFTVLFSEAVLGFDGSDISFAGSTLSNLTASVTGSGASYTVLITGMNGVGTVVTSVGANAATDVAGNFSTASTSTDNMVTFEAAASGIDLVGAVEWNPDDLLIPGDFEQATVIVSNVGDATAFERVKVRLYASADNVLDDSDILLDEGRTSGRINPGASRSVHLDFQLPGTLLPGEYALLAVVDATNRVAESNELNNTAIGQSFDFHWMFGNVPGHGQERITVRDADGTRVDFSLVGPGTGEITIDENGDWDLVVTGTNGSSVLSILASGGGDRRVELDDIHVTGALGGINAPRMDLTGTLAIDGSITGGIIVGSATGAVIAAPTILGTSVSGLDVQGISILGDLKNSYILIGANLGADGQLGGLGADSDSYMAGDLEEFLIRGSMISSSVRVGQDPVDGIFGNGDDVLLGGDIDSITIRGAMSNDSSFVSSEFPRFARIDGERVRTATDPRFWDSPPSFGLGVQGSIDWNAGAGAGWGAGSSPFGSSAGNGQSNFSDFS